MKEVLYRYDGDPINDILVSVNRNVAALLCTEVGAEDADDLSGAFERYELRPVPEAKVKRFITTAKAASRDLVLRCEISRDEKRIEAVYLCGGLSMMAEQKNGIKSLIGMSDLVDVGLIEGGTPEIKITFTLELFRPIIKE